MWELMRYPKEVMKLLLLQKYVVGRVGPKFSMEHQWLGTLGKNTGHMLVNGIIGLGFMSKAIFFGYMMMQEADLVAQMGAPECPTRC